MIEVTKEMFERFMREKDNAEILIVLDRWFQKKTGQQNINDILCLIQGVSILAQLAGKEMVELQMILQSGDKTFNA